MPYARFLEADWASHGHVMRARDCHVVVTRSAALYRPLYRPLINSWPTKGESQCSIHLVDEVT